ncbi:hypothetical protein [Arthrobacter sp. NEB 688]|uniref:hypothetical protein n=1 Tax=Arthrobacter sp. NEB 688 TaxID=904039 RepID=UPI001565D170|nr:hypothetical protein [Arthrobacter sp. NEB 688]QKE84285.1 hypothetical protein HL663_10280 [Arthrobacter sp. NEB 688]
MSDLPATSSTRATLDAAVADAQEAGHLRQVLTVLDRELEEARRELGLVERRHRLEADDVRRLEGVGWSALVAAVRGTRTGELDRERAEEAAARYALQAASARVADLESRRASTAERLGRLGDTPGRVERARRAHAEAVRAAGSSPELETVLDELARVEAQATELDEATTAGRRAAHELAAARERLGSAQSWSTYDTWLGGGLVASMVKHDRLDDAGRHVGAAQTALADFARELGDVGAVGALRADLGVGPTMRTVDVWFDNLFTDLSVRARIKDSLVDVDAAALAVRDVLAELGRRSAALAQERATLLQRRDELAAG